MNQTTHNDVPKVIDRIIERIENLEIVFRSGEKDLMTITETGEFLNLTVKTLYVKICKKEIPFIKMRNSKRVYFSRKELTTWLAASKVSAK